jgi:Carboxypeptidase regulatory-like domain
MKVKRGVLKEGAASLLVVFLLLSLGRVSVFAQTETGQIIVKAIDEKGAVVAGATVSVKSGATGTERKTTTNDEGSATITNLQPGRYAVVVEGTGFAPFTQQAEVTVGAKLSIEAQNQCHHRKRTR